MVRMLESYSSLEMLRYTSWGVTKAHLVDNFVFTFISYHIFCLVVAICDLVHLSAHHSAVGHT